MDLALLIDQYLSDKKHLIEDSDSFNASDLAIIRWDFVNIPCPTIEELEDLVAASENRQEQFRLNSEAQVFLNNTDFKVLRHIGQQFLGLETSLTSQEYLELEQERQMARDAIVN